MNKNNYFPFNSKQENKQIQSNSNEKLKYVENFNKQFKRPDCKCSEDDDPIDIESFLRNSYSQSKSKTSIQLSKKFSPTTFDINYHDNRHINNYENKFNKKKIVQPRYFNDKPYTGPGRGIGDVNISDNTRVGLDTRRYNEEYRNINEAEILDRFQFIDKRFQDPNNVVLPFPQGGVQTRDNKKLVKKCNQKFDFLY